jgi:hypothetical protein
LDESGFARGIVGGVKASWLVPIAACALSLLPARAHGADTDACIEQYDAAVAARKRGALLEARAGYATCASASCPTEIKAECDRGVQAMASEVPTLVFAIRGADGADVTSGRLTIDGKEIPDAMQGLPVDLDPGSHRLGLVLADGRKLEKSVVARAGEKNRVIRWDIPAKPKAPAPRKPAAAEAKSRSALGPVLLGVGGAALLGFGVFGVLGRSKQSALEDCKPRCAPDDIDSMQRLYLIADISLAVSIVALGAGSYFTLRSEPGESAFLGAGGRF